MFLLSILTSFQALKKRLGEVEDKMVVERQDLSVNRTGRALFTMPIPAQLYMLREKIQALVLCLWVFTERVHGGFIQTTKDKLHSFIAEVEARFIYSGAKPVLVKESDLSLFVIEGSPERFQQAFFGRVVEYVRTEDLAEASGCNCEVPESLQGRVLIYDPHNKQYLGVVSIPGYEERGLEPHSPFFRDKLGQRFYWLPQGSRAVEYQLRRHFIFVVDDEEKEATCADREWSQVSAHYEGLLAKGHQVSLRRWVSIITKDDKGTETAEWMLKDEAPQLEGKVPVSSYRPYFRLNLVACPTVLSDEEMDSDCDTIRWWERPKDAMNASLMGYDLWDDCRGRSYRNHPGLKQLIAEFVAEQSDCTDPNIPFELEPSGMLVSNMPEFDIRTDVMRIREYHRTLRPTVRSAPKHDVFSLLKGEMSDDVSETVEYPEMDAAEDTQPGGGLFPDRHHVKWWDWDPQSVPAFQYFPPDWSLDDHCPVNISMVTLVMRDPKTNRIFTRKLGDNRGDKPNFDLYYKVADPTLKNYSQVVDSLAWLVMHRDFSDWRIEASRILTPGMGVVKKPAGVRFRNYQLPDYLVAEELILNTEVMEYSKARVYGRPYWLEGYDSFSKGLPERLWQLGIINPYGQYRASFKSSGMDKRWLQFMWKGDKLRSVLPEVGLNTEECSNLGVIGIVVNVRNEFVSHFLRPESDFRIKDAPVAKPEQYVVGKTYLMDRPSTAQFSVLQQPRHPHNIECVVTSVKRKGLGYYLKRAGLA